jgi:hypothetical protein
MEKTGKSLRNPGSSGKLLIMPDLGLMAKNKIKFDFPLQDWRLLMIILPLGMRLLQMDKKAEL